MTQPMQTQTPFPPEQLDEDLDQADMDAAYQQRFDEEFQSMNRYDKLEWLQEICSEEFNRNLLHNIVASMHDQEFDGIFQYLCQVNMIARTPCELERWNQFGAGS